jgi:hypothetical protein
MPQAAEMVQGWHIGTQQNAKRFGYRYATRPFPKLAQIPLDYSIEFIFDFRSAKECWRSHCRLPDVELRLSNPSSRMCVLLLKSGMSMRPTGY